MNTRVIAITGFMAAGKTTIGRAVAQLLDLAFVDLDEAIVAREARAISAIIEADGEGAFREIETAVLKKVLLAREPCVVALGGGTWSVPENRTLLQRCHAHVVWLDAPFELCWNRIQESGGSRPLAASRTRAEQLYRERRASHQLANHRIEIGPDMTAAQCAAVVFGVLSQ